MNTNERAMLAKIGVARFRLGSRRYNVLGFHSKVVKGRRILDKNYVMVVEDGLRNPFKLAFPFIVFDYTLTKSDVIIRVTKGGEQERLMSESDVDAVIASEYGANFLSHFKKEL